MNPGDLERRIQAMLERLRGEPSRGGPGHGAKRTLRMARGALGMATNVWSSRKKKEQGGLAEGDLRSIERLVRELGELKGLPMKLGQMLGYLELDLPEEMRSLLALLQTQSPAASFEQAEATIREDLGERAPQLLAAMERKPASAASIGQVYRALFPDGTRAAVKVRYPEVDRAIRSDFSVATSGTAFASLLMPGAGATARDIVAELQARLLEECDYRLEAERQRTFGELFRASPDVLVPAVLDDWCGARVLTTRWEDGQPFEAFAATASQRARDRAGASLFGFYIGALYRHGLFHADPHPGNYLFRDDGRVVVFDYGCVRRFERSAVLAFVNLADAARAGDDALMRSALAGLGAEPPEDPEAFAHIRRLLGDFFRPVLRRGAHRIDARIAMDPRRVAKDKLAVARLRLPGSLAFLFRIRFGLYSVLARLGALCDWAELEQSYAQEAKAAAG